MKKKLLLVALAFVIIVAYNFYTVDKELEEISNSTILDFDFTSLADGVYHGIFETKILAAEVEVVIENEEIVEIRLIRHDHGRGEEAEKITEHVVTEQSLMVDTIAGATISSKVILKAIENAVTN
jgi:uncharacterized protein with FMN-binding domain